MNVGLGEGFGEKVGRGVGLGVGLGVGFTVAVGVGTTVGRGVGEGRRGDGISPGYPPNVGGGPGGGRLTFPPVPTPDGSRGMGRLGFCFRISAAIKSRLGNGGKFLINGCVRIIRRRSTRPGLGSFFAPALTLSNCPA